jgi:hypothetical protein
MKVLTICEGGNIRSVGCAFMLKQCVGFDALAASIRFNTDATMGMLYAWAEKIVAMFPEVVARIPEEWQSKVVLVDVGADRFGNCFHPELLNMLAPRLNNWKNAGYPVGLVDGKITSF